MHITAQAPPPVSKMTYTALSRLLNSTIPTYQQVASSTPGHCIAGQCAFWNVGSNVRYKLFRSYCTGMYGCELWYRDDSKISEFCTAWKKGLRRIWNLPQDTNCDTLHCLTNDLPVFYEMCRRCLNFIDTCLHHHNGTVRFFAWHGIKCTQGISFIDRKMKLCWDRYKCKLREALLGDVQYNAVIKRYCREAVDENCVRLGQFMQELIDYRDYSEADCQLTRADIRDSIVVVVDL